MTLDAPAISALVRTLPLETKVRLLTGQDFWSSWAEEGIGLRSMVFSDGPAGVRGPVWDERDPSLNLPSGTSLGSTWDVSMARGYGEVVAEEARRKGVDVVLGPTINLHRSPLGGRSFEAFSEDPVLTGRLAAAFVEGLQGQGVGACPKHYVANDYETERFTADTRVDQQALHEVYLAAFEEPVREGRAWAVMSAYNQVNGTTASESELLMTPLKTGWGFDGVVISDWSAVRSLASARAGQDFVMPGPAGPWGDGLVGAVRRGEVAEAVVDDKVTRLLLLAARVGALPGVPAAGVHDDARSSTPREGRAYARLAASAGSVLLRNDGILPLTPAQVRRVAVIGHNAEQPRTQGGGSATVVPESVRTPLDALRAAFADLEVDYALGAVVQDGIAPIPLDQLRHPRTGQPGSLVRFLDEQGTCIYQEDRRATTFTYFGGEAPIESARTYEVTFTWVPNRTRQAFLGFSAVGSGVLTVDGEVLVDATGDVDGMDLGAALLAPPAMTAPVAVQANRPMDVALRFDLSSRHVSPGLEGLFGLTVGTQADDTDADVLIAEAVDIARRADVAIVVVGTSPQIESEGFDRTDLRLPGRQDDLVAAVAAGTPTVVVVNAGAPVELPWRDDVSAILLTYFAGQEMGDALADMLTGVAEPGGRLPTTWPVSSADEQVLSVTPTEGHLDYTEGIHVGYRRWLRDGATPAFAFGHGLGYTTWQLTALDVAAGRTLALDVTNTGVRDGKQVVQAYLERPDSRYERPVRWLAGFAAVRVPAGGTTRVEIPLPERAFRTWHDGAWVLEPGDYTVLVGTSSTDLPLTTTLTL